jgi:hypothetical protein
MSQLEVAELMVKAMVKARQNVVFLAHHCFPVADGFIRHFLLLICVVQVKGYRIRQLQVKLTSHTECPMKLKMGLFLTGNLCYTIVIVGIV